MADIIEFKSKSEEEYTEILEALETSEKVILITEDEDLEMKMFAMGMESELDAIDMLHASMGTIIAMASNEDD